MPMAIGGQRPISAAFFNPQSRAPDTDYLCQLQAFLLRHPHGSNLLHHVTTLDTVWPIFTASRKEVRELPNAEHYVSLLIDWAKGGSSAPISEARTGVIALPLLLILQIGQYFAFLDSRKLSHAEFLDQVRDAGGIQGCCGGEPPALSIACARDEAQVVENAAIFLRIAMGVGLYIEALDDWTTSEPTIIAIRLKYAEQKNELLQLFPGTYVSAITEPRSLSFVGSATAIAQLYDYAGKHGLPADKMDVTGKAHNPENSIVVPEFLEVLGQNPLLFQLPPKSKLQVVVRSNRSGEKLQDNFVMEDMIIMMLAACCDWFKLLGKVAEDMETSKRPSHEVVIFGMNDSVPLSPFNRKRLMLLKTMAHSAIVSLHSPEGESYDFPASAIAIVGASCRLPGADNLAELWDLVSTRTDTHEEVLKGRIDLAKSLRASQDSSMSGKKFFGNFLSDVKRFDNVFFNISNKEAANMDPQQRLLLELSYEALESSGNLLSEIQGASVGCFIGSSLNEYLENITSHPSTAYAATGTIRAFLCGKLSHYYDWMAPSEVIDTACSSSLVAVNRACRAIQSGECTMAIAGGVSVISGVNSFLDLGKAGFLSPTGQCKPFDAAADGYCRAEGAGIVVLKSLDDALRAGDDILGVIPGVAENQGGPSPSLTVPSSVALKALYQNIVHQAGLEPSQITYAEAHGTGTQAGDPIEMESIRSVFGSSSRSSLLSVGSIKGNIGHCESAAGIAGLLKVLAMIKHGKIPPQASHWKLNPKIPGLELDHMEIPGSIKDWNAPLRAAVVNSYGAAGSNCALLCCEMASSRRKDPSSKFSGNNKIRLPIILSAASRSSLLRNARALGSFLSQAPPEAIMPDIAYTLNERRDRHRMCLEFSTADTSALESDSPFTFEYPKQSKPVVLALSGQHSSTISLPRSIYEGYPAFRHYIDTCDTHLVELGYQTIKEAIFQEGPISTAVSLQCSTFAVQYACASCWIDSGLRPAVIIGHSLGELVALALSGILSLQDCLSLVAQRASLIDNQWGTEKGAMLAIHCDSSEVQRLSSQLTTRYKGHSIEVACYNAPGSTVVVGTAAAIELAIRVLSTDEEFTGIKYTRLSTTHAFHSKFTEPILPGLAKASRGLKWKASDILLETCTPGLECLSYGDGWNPARHAREPVFFSDAVQRIEKRSGPCVWFEAGLNSPITAMTRRACLDPSSHFFQPTVTILGDSQDSKDCIGDVVASLWRQGISLSHWAFLGAEKYRFKQLWLPPYQFDRQPHWIENIDRAMEAHENRSASYFSAPQAEEKPLPAKLIVQKDTSSPNASVAKFSLNTKSNRFQELVRGHAVLQQPLCPAPLYMECTTMALQSLIDSIEDQHLAFEDLEFHSPLGLDLSREVELCLEEEMFGKLWKITFRSSLPMSQTATVIHCVGRVSLSRKSSMHVNARLVKNAIQNMYDCNMTERFMTQRAYGLFSKVMHYAPFFQGISSLTLYQNECIASVKLPSGQPGRDESTAWQRCDTALVDAFISVVGLLLNSSAAVGNDEICIAASIERVDLSLACQMDSPDDWLVYAKYSFEAVTEIIGDVFVCSSKREIVAIMAGVRFVKAKVAKMTKSLQLVNAVLPSDSHEVQVHCNEDVEAPKDKPSKVRQKTTVSASPEENIGTKLREMISGYTGLPLEDIPSGKSLVEMGIDSLSMIEFTADVLKDFGVEIPSPEYTELTLEGLITRVGMDLPSDSCIDVKGIEEEAKMVTSSGINQSSTLSDTENGFSVSTVSSNQSTPADPRASPGIKAFSAKVIPIDPIDGIARVDDHFDIAASRRGYSDYHSNVFPVQDDLTLAYILEALENFNINLKKFSPGTVVSPIPNVSKYDRLASRLWDILSNRGVITRRGRVIIRNRAFPDIASSDELHRTFISQFPMYEPEASLMKLAGQNLASCLKGQKDALKLMFGTLESNQIMEKYYSDSPMVSTLTDQLVSYVELLIQGWIGNRADPVRILEVGAGTGATTTRLAESLQCVGVPIQYVFTDVAGRMVAKAKDKFKTYSWMRFETFDLENEIPDSFRNKFDIVIGTNCVHATKSKVASCRRIWNTLSEQGVAILSEGTEALHWFDICFGLLDGWWLAEDGSHPLQPAPKWMEILEAAGFQSTGFSEGPSREALTQKLIVGWKKQPQASIHTGLTPGVAEVQSDESYKMSTMVYKEVSGLQIHADVYIPRIVRSSPLPIALMIHGGGYVMLSRKAIRPAQTKHLISQGFLPVSIDYRLCPEVTMIDGPLSDVKSGYCWARSELPSRLLAEHGVSVDSEKIVAIGWSTGGHLAMSLAWTTRDEGIPSPDAILSFYAPIDFQGQGLDSQSKKHAPLPRSKYIDLLQKFHGPPISNYDPQDSDTTNYFGLRPGDPRSDLLLSTSHSGAALSLFLNGIPDTLTPNHLSFSTNSSPSIHKNRSRHIDPSRLFAIDPLTQLRAGNYHTPTFIIHSRRDEVAPFDAAEEFIREMNRIEGTAFGHGNVGGGKAGLLTLDVPHLHDVTLRPGMAGWEEQVIPGYKFLMKFV